MTKSHKWKRSVYYGKIRKKGGSTKNTDPAFGAGASDSVSAGLCEYQGQL